MVICVINCLIIWIEIEKKRAARTNALAPKWWRFFVLHWNWRQTTAGNLVTFQNSFAGRTVWARFYVKWIAHKYCNHRISPLHMKMMKIFREKNKTEPATFTHTNISSAEKNELFQSKRYFLIAVFMFLHFIASVLYRYVIRFSSFPLLFCNSSTFSLPPRTIFLRFVFNYFGQLNRIISI